MNRSKANAGMISIGNLIKGDPYIPEYNPKAGNIYRDIILPTIRSIEALRGIFSFKNINEFRKQNNILTFLTFVLKYKPTNYPSFTAPKALKYTKRVDTEEQIVREMKV